MNNLMTSELLELHQCRKSLNEALEVLDRIGAGIAAIHVNAAIEQLNHNLDLSDDEQQSAADIMTLTICEPSSAQH